MIGGIFQNPTKVFFGKETLHLLKRILYLCAANCTAMICKKAAF